MAHDDATTPPPSGFAGSPSGDVPARRAEDAAVMLFGIGRGAEGVAADLASFRPTPEALANAAFLIDIGGDQALVVPAADAHVLPRGGGAAELQERAAAMAQALHRERDWVRRRLQMPDYLLAYADRLQGARTEADVYEAVRVVATPVMGAYTAVVYVALSERRDAEFHPSSDAALRLQLDPLPPGIALQFAEQRLLTWPEANAEPAASLAPLTKVIDATGAVQLLFERVGSDALLMLAERRRDRIVTGEDRDLLQALVRQAEAALRRILSERRVAVLDKT